MARIKEVTRYGIMFDGLPTLGDACDSAEQDWPELLTWRLVANDPTVLTYHEDDVEAMDETNFAAILDELGLKRKDIPRVERPSFYGGSVAMRTEDSRREEYERLVAEAVEVGACFVDVYLSGWHGSLKCLLIAPYVPAPCVAGSAMGFTNQVVLVYTHLLTDEQRKECGPIHNDSKSCNLDCECESWTSEWIETHTAFHWHDGEVWDCSVVCRESEESERAETRIESAEQMVAGLADNPLLDEEAYSAREWRSASPAHRR
jgi:hypothetical protein